MTERLELHNVSVDEDLALVGACGQIHLPTGQTCNRAHHHRDSCSFVAPKHSTHSAGVADALEQAAVSAGLAPSIHNTQPWRWRLAGDTLDLFTERRRTLDVTDPDGRLAMTSCGAALHHARIALAALGWHAGVTRLPDPADPEHLARLRVDRPSVAGPDAIRLAPAIPLRHTDRRPVTGSAVLVDELTAVIEAVESQETHLHVLAPEQILALAAAIGHTPRAENAESQWHQELARSTGGGLDHDQPALFTVLYGPGDSRVDWLRAGEALSALWLTATGLGITVLPFSAPIEATATREALRHQLAGLGHPYLALRLGHPATPDSAGPYTPRLPADQTVERSAV